MRDKGIDQFIRNVGRRIGETRAKGGMTQAQLAEKADVSIQLIQYWESGKNITIRTLYRLSKLLDCSTIEFLKLPKTGVHAKGRPVRK